MNNLLSASFARLKKNKIFWICTFFSLLLGIFEPTMQYIDTRQHGFIHFLDDAFFAYAAFIGIVLAVFCSLFTGAEYGDGTIRNKLVIGHTRASVYLSNLVTVVAAGFLLYAAFTVPYLCIGIPLLGFFDLDFRIVLLLILCVLAMIIALCSIYTLIAMLCQHRAIVAVICILSAFLLLIAGFYVKSRLDEPEMYSAYSYSIGGETTEISEQPNPRYLTGVKREVYEFLYDFLPGGQAVQYVSMEAARPGLLLFYSVLIAAGSTAAGLIFFRRKDIK